MSALVTLTLRPVQLASALHAASQNLASLNQTKHAVSLHAPDVPLSKLTIKDVRTVF